MSAIKKDNFTDPQPAGRFSLVAGIVQIKNKRNKVEPKGYERMGNGKDIADKTITTTPRTLAVVAVGLIGAYAWVLTNFVTTADMDTEATVLTTQIEQVSANLREHIDEQTIWKLESKMEDIGDKKWLVQQRISQPGGDTSANREQVRELEKREVKAERSLRCFRNGGQHCISNDSG